MTSKNLAKLCMVCATLAGWGAGCDSSEPEPISASQMALSAQGNVEGALRGLHSAGAFLADSTAVADLLSVPGGETCTSTSTPCMAGTTCVSDPEPTCVPNSVTTEDLAEGRQELSDAIDTLVKKLREEVFIPANLESEDGKTATYRVPAAFLCGSDGGEVAKAASTPTQPTQPSTLDPACVEDVARLQPRLRLTSTGEDSVDIAVVLTASQRSPVTFSLAANSVSAKINLGEVKAALDAAGEDTDELESMAGSFALEVKRNADRDYSLRLNVVSDLGITTKDSLAQLIAIGLGARSPTVEIRLDGNAKKVTGTLDVGAFSLRGPLNAFRDMFEDSAPVDTQTVSPPAKTYTGIIDLLVAGLSGSMTFDGNRERFELRGLGLGSASSTLKHDGVVLSKLDINPSAGRRFDLTIEKGGDGKTVLGFAPSFDLSLLLDFASLQSQISDLPSILLGETLGIRFDGAQPKISIEPDQDQVRILSGNLSMTSAKVPSANLQATAGACLRESTTDSDPPHQILSALSVGVCQ